MKRAILIICLLVGLPIVVFSQIPNLTASMNAREYRAFANHHIQKVDHGDGLFTITIRRTITRDQLDRMNERRERMRNRLQHLRSRSDRGNRIHHFMKHNKKRPAFRGVRIKVKH